MIATGAAEELRERAEPGGTITIDKRALALTMGSTALVAVLVILGIRLPGVAIALVLGAAFVVITTYRPAFGLVSWIAVVAFIPDWTPIHLGPIGLRPSVVLGLAVLAGLLLSRKRGGSPLAWPDFALAGAVAIVLALTVLAGYPAFLLVNLALVLGLSYTLGRLSIAEVRTAFVVVMVIVSIWGLVEFATGLHVWSDWAPSAFHHWGDVQVRAGVERSEAGFGHAIAYGATIAMAIPFARELAKHAVLAQLILAAGVVVSLSRGPLLALTLTLGLSIFAATSGRRRVGSFLLFGVSMVVIAVTFQLLYSEDDASDTRMSGEQRALQLERALPAIRWLGASAGVQVDDAGRLQSATIDVIDNTLLRLGANFGWLVAVLILAPILFAAVLFVVRKATPASIALLGQIPVLAVTSLITQWQAFLFFVAGMAVTELVQLRRAQRERVRERDAADEGARARPEPAGRPPAE